MSGIRWLASAAVVACAVMPAWAQVNVQDAQAKLLAKRAAEADAYRKLAETVKGLQINSTTYVKDFVAESDEIRAHLDEFIKGVRLGQPRWFDDLSCEVPGEVTVEKVVQLLQESHERYYKGSHVKARDIQDLQQHVERKVLKVIGKGAPRIDLPPDLPQGVAEQVMAEGPPPAPEPFVPELWKRIPAPARLGAERAAELDASRKLVERILGLRVNSDTLVRDFVTESDEIRTSTVGTLIGAQRKQTFYHSDEPIVEVTMEVPIESVISTIKELHTRCSHCGRVKGSDVTEIKRTLHVQMFEATGMGVPNPKYLQQINAMIAVPEEQIPSWAMGVLKETGSAVAPPDKVGTPQGKLLAARGAEVDAKRKLAARIKGLRLVSNTQVKDFVAEHDEIVAYIDAVIANAEVEKTRFKEDGSAEVTVVMQGMELWEVLQQQPGQPLGPPPGVGAGPGRPGQGPPPRRGPAGRRPGRPGAAPQGAPPPPPPPAPEKDDAGNENEQP